MWSCNLRKGLYLWFLFSETLSFKPSGFHYEELPNLRFLPTSIPLPFPVINFTNAMYKREGELFLFWIACVWVACVTASHMKLIQRWCLLLLSMTILCKIGPFFQKCSFGGINFFQMKQNVKVAVLLLFFYSLSYLSLPEFIRNNLLKTNS